MYVQTDGGQTEEKGRRRIMTLNILFHAFFLSSSRGERERKKEKLARSFTGVHGDLLSFSDMTFSLSPMSQAKVEEKK